MPPYPLCLIHQYRSAVYLNNAATTFMARGEYQEALSTMKDALSLMETIVRPERAMKVYDTDKMETSENGDLNRSGDATAKDIQFKIHHVAQRLACCNHTTIGTILPMEILCYDGSLDSRFLLMLQQQTKDSVDKQQVAVPIRISDVLVDNTTDEEMQMNLTEIAPAIMLSNYALAHLCYFKATNNYNALDGTLRLLDMAVRVLCIHEKLLCLSSSSDDDDEYEDKYMCFTEGCLFVALAISMNVNCIPKEAATTSLYRDDEGCVISSESIHVSSCTMINDLDVLQSFAKEWLTSNCYKVTSAVHGASTSGTIAAAAA
jgi:hypothetical protein